MKQILAVTQVCKKYLAESKDVYWTYMNLGKASERIDRESLWIVQDCMG